MRKAKSRPGKLKLTKRNDSPYWYITGSIEGKRINESTGTVEKVWADEQRIKLEARYQHARVHGQASLTTFGDAAVMYINAGRCQRFIKPLVLYYGETLLKDMTYSKVMEAAHNLYPNAAPATINRQCIGKTSAIVNFALRAEGKPRIDYPSMRVDNKRICWMTPEEAERLIEAARGRNHLPHIILFLLGTGTRLGEALKLKPESINMNTRQARIEKTKTEPERWVEFPARTAAALASMETLHGYGTPIFRTQFNRPYVVSKNTGGSISEPFAGACLRAGLPIDGEMKVTPHTCRHTWATWFNAQDNNMKRLKDLGGWRKLDTVDRYTKLAPRDLGERLKAFSWDFAPELHQFSGDSDKALKYNG